MVELYQTRVGQTDNRTSIFCPIAYVRNFRIFFFKKGQCSIFRTFYKILSAIILGIPNFRVLKLLGHLRYFVLYFSHEELLALNGSYYDMWQQQLTKLEETEDKNGSANETTEVTIEHNGHIPKKCCH